MKRSAHPIQRGGVAVGLIAGISIGVILTIGIEKFFSVVMGSSVEQIFTLFTALTAIGSIFIAFLALSEQNKMRQAGTDPVLIVHLSQREDAKELMMIKVTNVGAGAALDVMLKIDADLSQMDISVFREDLIGEFPFPTIPQGDACSVRLGRGFVIFKDPPYPKIKASVAYRSIEGDIRSEEFLLDTAQMAKLGAHRSMELRRTVSLEKIASNLSKAEDMHQSLIGEVTDIKDAVRHIAKLK